MSRPSARGAAAVAGAAPADEALQPGCTSSGSAASSASIASSRRALESVPPPGPATAAAAGAAAGTSAAAAAPQRQHSGDDGSGRGSRRGGRSSSSGGGRRRRGRCSYARGTLLLSLLLVSAVLAQYLDAAQLQQLIEGVQAAPLASMLVFVLLFGAAVVLLVPGMLLSIGAGAAYGLAAGTLLAWAGTLLGQVGAFLLGRYLLRDMVVAYLEKRVSRFAAIDASLSADGWKLVLLLRLSPVLPYNIMNYALGVTAIDLVPYAAASGVAAVPYVALFAYLGSITTDLYGLLHDGARGALSPELLIAAACVMVLSGVGLFAVARHAIVDAPPAPPPAADETDTDTDDEEAPLAA